MHGIPPSLTHYVALSLVKVDTVSMAAGQAEMVQ